MAEFKLYDFDTEFSNYLQKWYEKNFGRFHTYDEMEDCVPEVYQTFLDSPAPFLNGEKPGKYFEKFDDPVLLVDWLKEYVHQDINVPDMLLNRISDLGENAAPILITRNEFMRRYREMSSFGGGMNFYGEMPEAFDIKVNLENPVMAKIVSGLKENKEKIEEYAEGSELLKQVTDLALLANGMLKGKALADFIARSEKVVSDAYLK